MQLNRSAAKVSLIVNRFCCHLRGLCMGNVPEHGSQQRNVKIAQAVTVRHGATVFESGGVSNERESFEPLLQVQTVRLPSPQRRVVHGSPTPEGSHGIRRTTAPHQNADRRRARRVPRMVTHPHMGKETQQHRCVDILPISSWTACSPCPTAPAKPSSTSTPTTTENELNNSNSTMPK